jgi:hypothetical protein
MRLVGYLYEDYHDARSFEHKARNTVVFVKEIIITSEMLLDIAIYL